MENCNQRGQKMQPKTPKILTEGFHIESLSQFERIKARRPDLPSPWQDSGWHTVLDFFSPGRVNLIGEHMDYTGGLSLPFAIDLGIHFVLEQTPMDVSKDKNGSDLFVAVAHGHSNQFALLQQSEPASTGESKQDLSYLNGAWHIAKSQWPEDPAKAGLAYRIRISSTLPTGSGLSSSAAYTLGLLICLARIRGAHQLQAAVLARLAQRVEHEFAGTPCGLMDQITILQTPDYGFLELDFGSAPGPAESTIAGYPAITKHSFAAIGSRWRVALFQTGRKHKLSDGSYETRRRECETAAGILAKFTSKTSANHSNVTLGELLPKQLGATRDQLNQAETLVARLEDRVLRSRTQYVFSEIERAQSTIRAISDGDVAAISNNLDAAQDGLRDRFQVSCTEVDLAVSLIRRLKIANGVSDAVMGPRMMGGGWGGSLILLIDKESESRIKTEFDSLIQTYDTATGCHADLIFTEPHHGLVYEPALADMFNTEL
jgi:galactokinase